MTSPELQSLPFAPGEHRVADFESGEPDLDRWLIQAAEAAARARTANTFVWVNANDEVRAFYSLSAHTILREEAGQRIGRGGPELVPAALIGKLALHKELRGQQLGEVLLADALRRLVRLHDRGPAFRAIVVDAATESGLKLYRRMGFVPSPVDRRRLLMRTETAVRLFQ